MEYMTPEKKLRAFTLVDSRICTRCGARAGNCEHLRADPVTIEMMEPNNGNRYETGKWEREEIETLRNLYPTQFSLKQIADAMNKTPAAIAGQAYRLGLRR